MKKPTPYAIHSSSGEMLEAALDLARRGFWVLPLEPGGKKPHRGVANGYKDATREKRQIRQWWTDWPDANIGVALGRKYNLIAVDVDGPSGADEVARLEREFGDLPTTREATSGRPHRKHLFYRYPSDGSEVRRRIKINGAALDLLTDGYVLVAPSIHPKTGKPYRWIHKRKVAPFPAMLRHLGVRPSASASSPMLGDVLPEGGRDVALTSLAGSMRRRGASEEAILAALREENQRKCRPPLGDRDLQKIARSIGKKEPLPQPLLQVNDITLAERFAQIEEADLRYVPQWRKWLVWDGRRWAPDVTLEAERRVEAMINGLFGLLDAVPNADDRERIFKPLNRYANHRRLGDILNRARSNIRMVVTPDKLDDDPWLFNVDNGTLDLRTFDLLPHDSDRLLTKRSPIHYDPEAEAPRWKRFIDDICKSDSDLGEFLQRAVGYSLVGVTQEHVLFFCYGSGANGKSTFLEVLHDLFGDYAITIDFETLLHHRSQSGESRRDLPRLHKARLVTANETPTNARWDERTIKQLTGGDTLSGRWLYQEKFEFTPTHTIWCRGNDQPRVEDLSAAFWRRLRLVPFRRSFGPADQVKDLREQLSGELPGILNWALAGCRAWQNAGGLPEPARVAKATESYRKSEDVYGRFIEERCVRREDAWEATAHLYADFEAWWSDNQGRVAPPPVRGFAKGLQKQAGLRAAKRRHARGWRGIALRDRKRSGYN